MSEIVIHVHGDTDAELKEHVDAAMARGKPVSVDVRRNVRREHFLGRGSRLVGEGGTATVIVDVDGEVEALSANDRLLVDMVRRRALTSVHAEAIEELVQRLESRGEERAASVMRQLAKQAGVL